MPQLRKGLSRRGRWLRGNPQEGQSGGCRGDVMSSLLYTVLLVLQIELKRHSGSRFGLCVSMSNMQSKKEENFKPTCYLKSKIFRQCRMYDKMCRTLFVFSQAYFGFCETWSDNLICSTNYMVLCANTLTKIWLLPNDLV
eukprot:TRINITY_DN1461_c0_g1_i4.p4 TRINITY_DN1461_c0_g1~~TRINITY_DN1461_c0_g1_i4.p4  ORF type:complete len:140 (-),score=5.68 TRINITY_DN1461_c0_g1_i4:601-1020(-)